MSLSSPGTVRVPEQRDFSSLAEQAALLQTSWETHVDTVRQSRVELPQALTRVAELLFPHPLDEVTHDWDWTRHQRVLCRGSERTSWPAEDCGTLLFRDNDLLTPSDGTSWLGADLLASLVRRVATLPANSLPPGLQWLLAAPLRGSWGFWGTYIMTYDDLWRIRSHSGKRRRS